MYLFSFLWNEILVLIFNMVIYVQRLAIQFVEMHCTRTHKFFLYIDQHPGNNCVLFIELFTNRHVSAITTVFLFQLLQFDYEVWEIIIYFTTCFSFLTFVLYWFPTKNLDRSWTIGQTGRKFFSAEDYTNMSYYNCCGIRPKHSNISKRVGEGVTTICVVLDQSTNISKGVWGCGGYYNLCEIRPKAQYYFKRGGGGGGITICVVSR